MKRVLSAVFIGLLGYVITCVDVWAQATAQISGVARDQSGAVLPGVEVTATQTGTGISRMTVTNETGTYLRPEFQRQSGFLRQQLLPSHIDPPLNQKAKPFVEARGVDLQGGEIG